MNVSATLPPSHEKDIFFFARQSFKSRPLRFARSKMREDFASSLRRKRMQAVCGSEPRIPMLTGDGAPERCQLPETSIPPMETGARDSHGAPPHIFDIEYMRWCAQCPSSKRLRRNIRASLTSLAFTSREMPRHLSDLSCVSCCVGQSARTAQQTE